MVEFEDDENIRGRPNWVDGFDVEGPLHTDEASIRDWGRPSYFIKKEDGGSTFWLSDRDGGTIGEYSAFHNALGEIENQEGGGDNKVHIKLSDGTFVWTDRTDFSFSFKMSGQGKNRTYVSRGGGINSDFLHISGSEPIVEFEDIKFNGRLNLSGAASIIVNDAGREFMANHCEWTNIPAGEAGVLLNDAESWNYFDHCWFPSSDGDPLMIDNTSEDIHELNLTGCMFDAQSRGVCLNVTSGALVENINITGGSARGKRPFRFANANVVNITGVMFRELREWGGIFMPSRGSQTSADMDVKGCTFVSDESNIPDYHIFIRDNWDSITLENNRFVGSINGKYINVESSTVERIDNNPATTDAYDSAPANPFKGMRAIASATWDPDGDGNAEKVQYDGTAWNEIVDLPNW